MSYGVLDPSAALLSLFPLAQTKRGRRADQNSAGGTCKFQLACRTKFGWRLRRNSAAEGSMAYKSLMSGGVTD